ncbi:MAG: phosphatase PAP2 family protein [Caldiserica bacterium]|nr:phosphatase PAP2 family protein [Caldisericota bacterium]
MRRQASFIVSRARLWLENPWPFAALVGAALLYVAALASGLAEDVLDNESIVLADGWLVHWLAAHRTAVGIGFFDAVSSLGNWQVVLIVLIGTTIFLWNQRRRAALALMLSCAGSELVVFFGKAGFGRPRPPAILAVVTELDASFPSGHANISVALYALGFYLLFRATRSPRLRALWLVLAALFPLLIGFSRLYIGAHYLSDVLAGWSVGLWWSILALGAFGFVRRRRATQSQTADLRSRPNIAK